MWIFHIILIAEYLTNGDFIFHSWCSAYFCGLGGFRMEATLALLVVLKPCSITHRRDTKATHENFNLTSFNFFGLQMPSSLKWNDYELHLALPRAGGLNIWYMWKYFANWWDLCKYFCLCVCLFHWLFICRSLFLGTTWKFLSNFTNIHIPPNISNRLTQGHQQNLFLFFVRKRALRFSVVKPKRASKMFSLTAQCQF